jgi:hypothetical protein
MKGAKGSIRWFDAQIYASYGLVGPFPSGGAANLRGRIREGLCQLVKMRLETNVTKKPIKPKNPKLTRPAKH